jgi:cephalosporin hydroxylase
VTVKSMVRAATRKILGPAGYETCRTLYRRALELRRTGNPREHFDSFASESTARPHGTDGIGQVFYAHDGRLIHKWGHYLEVYDRFLSPLKSRATTRLLELGVSHGGSLQMWRKYFGPEARIAGVDLDPRTEFSEPNTRVFIGRQDDPLTLGRTLEWLGGIDVVIDDGSHIVQDQMATLDHLFPRLSEGGIYICEDLHTNYWNWSECFGTKFGGGYRKRNTFIERIKRAVDDLNQWHHRFGAKDGTLRGRLFGIHFYDSMIVLEKRAVERPFHIKVGTPAF